MPLYKHHDQASLDAQFTLDTIADLPALFARRAEASRAALEQFACRRALRHAAGPGRTLNLFPPENARGPAPVQMFIHGGFWRSLDADLFSFVAGGFVPFGAAVAVIDYPLMPGVRMAELLEACRDAVTFLHRHAADLGLDPERLFVSGNSAGGHLVAELADAGWLADAGLPGDTIKGATAISGLFDLEPVRLSFQNDSIGLTREEVARFSPLTRPYRPAAPVIAAVGGDETAEFLAQNADFAAMVAGAGMNHVTVVLDAFAAPSHRLNQAVRRQMGL